MQTLQTPQKYYDANGYYIFRKLIPDTLIDQLMERYQAEILPSDNYFFRQSSTRWEKNKISESGYCQGSFLNIHDLEKYPEFSEISKKIFCLPEVRAALTQLTESPNHNLMQSMLFDQNTATPAHQDWYYLDSMPNGHMMAGWFALEDIHEEAGRFFVLPKSNHVTVHLNEDEKSSKATYERKLKEYTDAHQDEIYAPALQKGDVLFWNSRTIHGALPTINPQYSRKSLTAHYLPSQYQSGSLYAKVPSEIDYGEYEGMKYRVIPTRQRHFSIKTKLETDFWAYAWDRPYLARPALAVKKVVKKLKGKE
ncbi:MAG: phytanoyl-CoA dioxygenase family protein [Kastovskya adunca ATA6-11-RM4]|jgi:phytanoyl-CoA hydroxylase|nr:phytanoyl-CoA dioxygenase family protein [Kastovskya adunca ATA6-11-RM4]